MGAAVVSWITTRNSTKLRIISCGSWVRIEGAGGGKIPSAHLGQILNMMMKLISQTKTGRGASVGRYQSNGRQSRDGMRQGGILRDAGCCWCLCAALGNRME